MKLLNKVIDSLEVIIIGAIAIEALYKVGGILSQAYQKYRTRKIPIDFVKEEN